MCVKWLNVGCYGNEMRFQCKCLLYSIILPAIIELIKLDIQHFIYKHIWDFIKSKREKKKKKKNCVRIWTVGSEIICVCKNTLVNLTTNKRNQVDLYQIYTAHKSLRSSKKKSVYFMRWKGYILNTKLATIKVSLLLFTLRVKKTQKNHINDLSTDWKTLHK